MRADSIASHTSKEIPVGGHESDREDTRQVLPTEDVTAKKKKVNIITHMIQIPSVLRRLVSAYCQEQN